MPVIALGTTCLTAFALRRLGLDGAPMPFDWLATSPGMIRHCLRTDFAVLLDRAQYRSQTGLRGASEPVEGCAHDFYAREHGLACVFNHTDPTQEGAYRYLIACVDRFRGLLQTPGRKSFVQVSRDDRFAVRDFEAMSTLLDTLTPGASLLQIGVAPPDKLLSLPQFSIEASAGEHTLYRMLPISRMTGEGFLGVVDRQAMDGLIASYARSGGQAFDVGEVVSASASVEVNCALANARLVAHIANRGQTQPDNAGWTGDCGSGLVVEGMSIESDVARICDGLSYQVAERPGAFSRRGSVGQYLGTMGLSRPIYGLGISVTDEILTRYSVSLEAAFIDGTIKGPVVDQNSCQCLSEVPMEAVRLIMTDRG